RFAGCSAASNSWSSGCSSSSVAAHKHVWQAVHLPTNPRSFWPLLGREPAAHGPRVRLPASGDAVGSDDLLRGVTQAVAGVGLVQLQEYGVALVRGVGI